MHTLPTCADGDFGFDVRGRVERPVVDDFRIVRWAIGAAAGGQIGGTGGRSDGDPLLAVDVQRHVGKVHADGVVMPGVVTNLK